LEAAAAAGANYVELDVRSTKDGELVLMHDSTVNRTTNGEGAVRDLTFDAIRKLDAGKGQRVPTLREALLWAKQKDVRIDIDHKDGAVEAIARVVRETGMTRRVVIEGPRERLSRFAELLPGVDTMPKVVSAEDALATCKLLRTTVLRLSLEQLTQAEMVAAVHGCGSRISVTILGETDTEESIHNVILLGAQLIETDHPDLVAKVRSTKATISQIGIRKDGGVEITLSDGMTLRPPLRKRDESDQMGGQESCSESSVSSDRSAGGWFANFRWPGVSYPVAQEIAVYRPGRAVKWVRPAETDFLVMSAWKFAQNGKQVAFRREPLHGAADPIYELRDVETGNLVAKYPNEKVPEWVGGLLDR
jgi:glycerophosphoryl diester phosphodiesterase